MSSDDALPQESPSKSASNTDSTQEQEPQSPAAGIAGDRPAAQSPHGGGGPNQLTPEAIADAYRRSGLDIQPCMMCGKPVVCLPDGVVLCEECVEREVSDKTLSVEQALEFADCTQFDGDPRIGLIRFRNVAGVLGKEVRELRATVERLRAAMDSIVIRCQQGWPHRNWQEEVREIATQAKAGGDS